MIQVISTEPITKTIKIMCGTQAEYDLVRSVLNYKEV